MRMPVCVQLAQEVAQDAIQEILYNQDWNLLMSGFRPVSRSPLHGGMGAYMYYNSYGSLYQNYARYSAA